MLHGVRVATGWSGLHVVCCVRCRCGAHGVGELGGVVYMISKSVFCRECGVYGQCGLHGVPGAHV